jgi:protein-disulfide isomerase
MDDHAYTEQITKGYYQSLMLGISGTPTIFVNDVLCARTGNELVEMVRALADASGR